LEISQHPLSKEDIATTDFITVYGMAFGIADMNLQEDDSYKYCESATRHERMDAALKELVL